MSRDPASAVEPDVPWATHALVSLQLGLIALVIYTFDLESPAFFELSLVVWIGFTIHARLPRRFRLLAFVALGIAAAVILFGVRAAAWIAGTILALLLVCRERRLPRWLRAVLALAMVGALLLARIHPSSAPAPLQLVLPILASMLLFRLPLLLQAHRGETRPALLESFAYLFLLPNLCFTLFPVIGFATFRRSRDHHSARVYQTGVRWLALGICQLLLYRLVYYRLSVAPSHIASRLDAIRWMVASYLMYLRISGDFHMCIGTLCLFGFDLPPSHSFYFLASSFTDFYRRINVYWKELMLNELYVPVFLRLRKMGGPWPLVGATFVVFIASWLLHSYQWFWLRGSFPIRGQDILFWGILGALVLATSLVEERRGRERWIVPPRPSLRRIARRAAGTVLTFTTICLLWSMWTSDSPAAWRLIVGRVLAW
jgi:D-alanyl-lipoteichoic acid acyltransferase DltB (MBOAT superfamily)